MILHTKYQLLCDKSGIISIYYDELFKDERGEMLGYFIIKYDSISIFNTFFPK